MPRKAKVKNDSAPTNITPEQQVATITADVTTTPQTSIKIENTDHLFDKDGELVVDVFETNSDFVVTSAIAGVQIKDLDISVEKDMMVIKGQRVNPHHDLEKKYVHQECYWGPFSRKIVLPDKIQTDAAQAQMEKGMLVIKIPKIIDGGSNKEINVS